MGYWLSIALSPKAIFSFSRLPNPTRAPILPPHLPSRRTSASDCAPAHRLRSQTMTQGSIHNSIPRDIKRVIHASWSATRLWASGGGCSMGFVSRSVLRAIQARIATTASLSEQDFPFSSARAIILVSCSGYANGVSVARRTF